MQICILILRKNKEGVIMLSEKYKNMIQEIRISTSGFRWTETMFSNELMETLHNRITESDVNNIYKMDIQVIELHFRIEWKFGPLLIRILWSACLKF